MTIDEAIARERQQAKEQRNHIGTWDDEYSKKCEVYAEEHEQLAEWLEDYKQIKMLVPIEQALNNEYNKAIDDCIKEVEEEEKQHNHTITKDCLFWLKRKFELLKAGGENEI